MIELNGIQISDNNINTKKNVKIYVDEKQLDIKVGELQDLETTNKSSIVKAINEIKNTTDTLQVDVNRIYSDFTIIPNTPTEQEFTYKKSDEGVIEDGVAVIDKVKGKSLVWNQLADALTSSKWTNRHNNVTYLNNVLTYNKIPEIEYAENYPIENHAYFKSGHKYLCTLVVTNVNNGTIQFGESDTSYLLRASTIGFHYGFLVATTNDQLRYLTEGTSISVKDVSVYDLTQMFGAGNEPTTYEEFLSRKPKVADEYAYNEGTIVNNKVEKVVTTGRNLCPYLEQGTLSISNGSEQSSETRVRTPFIPISNKHSYCTMLNKWSIRNGCFYDRNKNFISSGYPSTINGVLDSSAIPANAAFCRLIYSAQNSTDVVTPSYDVFMFAIGNTTIPTTKYEPYEKHELDLSWVKEIKDGEGVKLFEDGMRSTGSAFDEVRKGRAIKRIGVKIFDGTEDWALSSGMYYLGDHTLPNSPKVVNSICNTYSFSNKTAGFQPGYDHTYGLQALGAIVFNDSTYTGVTAWKSHLAELYAAGNPLVVYYELAEPIEVEYDEKNLTYPVVAGGTEQAIASEDSTPMRASITYGSNTVATILSLINRVNELERKITN